METFALYNLDDFYPHFGLCIYTGSFHENPNWPHVVNCICRHHCARALSLFLSNFEQKRKCVCSLRLRRKACHLLCDPPLELCRQQETVPNAKCIRRILHAPDCPMRKRSWPRLRGWLAEFIYHSQVGMVVIFTMPNSSESTEIPQIDPRYGMHELCDCIDHKAHLQQVVVSRGC